MYHSIMKSELGFICFADNCPYIPCFTTYHQVIEFFKTRSISMIDVDYIEY